MLSVEFSANDPLRVRKRENLEEDDTTAENEVSGAGFDNTVATQRSKRQKYLASYISDSSDEYESDSDSGTQHTREDPESLKTRDDVHNSDQDMFASGEEDDAIDTSQPSRKSGLQLLDIVQFNKENIEGSDEEMNENRVLEEKDQVKIEAFDIEEESKNGVFDIDGNYLEAEKNSNDQIQDQDLWIQDFKDVQKTAEAQNTITRINIERRRKLEKHKKHYMLEEALIRMQYFLPEGHTVLEILGTLNKLRKKISPNTTKDSTDLAAKEHLVNAINCISELISILENKGIESVYELTRFDIRKLIKEESITGSNQVDNYKTKLWSFKWLGKVDTAHGMYTNYQMQYWKKAYFNHKALVKFDGEPDEKSNWIHVDYITFM